MVLPLALFLCAGEDPSAWGSLALVLTDRAGLGSGMLILQFHAHPQPLSFIGERVAHTASRPLVNLLIILGANIHVLPEISNVADDHGLYTLFIQRRNKSCCLLMLDILDLMLEFAQLFLL